MTNVPEHFPLPAFVNWPIFPFEGDFRVREYKELQPHDRPRTGEPGGGPCETCRAGDDAYIPVVASSVLRSSSTFAPPLPITIPGFAA